MVFSSISRAFSTPKFFFDEEVRDQIFQIIKEAEQEIYLVSPYNKHPNQLENALHDAIQRGVSVTMIYRDDKDQHEGVRSLKSRATVLSAKWLHAKIYMNESTALATSMNLLDSSFNNSLEFGFRVDKAQPGGLYQQLEDYVIRLRERIEQSNPPIAPKLAPRPASTGTAKSTTRRRSAPEAASQPSQSASTAKSATPTATTGTDGHCIRCGENIPFDTYRPYCMACYTSWNYYHKKRDNRHRPEPRCHDCGRIAETSEAKTSMANPLGPCCSPTRA